MQELVCLACLHVAWGPEEPDLKKTGTEPASHSYEKEMPELHEKATGTQAEEAEKGPLPRTLRAPRTDFDD